MNCLLNEDLPAPAEPAKKIANGDDVASNNSLDNLIMFINIYIIAL
jgi:hypothetical protein